MPYSRQWEMGEPFTILSKAEGELSCPWIQALPCGDLVAGYWEDGDYYFSRIKVMRSSDGGATWEPDTAYPIPSAHFVRIDADVVRKYSRLAFAVRGSEPRKFLLPYCESVDGGKTFGAVEYGAYEQHGVSTTKVSDLMRYVLHDKIIYWDNLLAKAGWEKRYWLEAVMGYWVPDDKCLIRLGDSSLLTFVPDILPEYPEGHSMLAIRSTDGGVNWAYYSTVVPYIRPTQERGYYEPYASTLADGRIYVVIRAGGGGVPCVHTWSADGGKTWTTARIIDERVAGVQPRNVRLSDGALAMCNGRPGMFLTFDPTGTGEHWEVDDRFDATVGEELSIKTNAKPLLARVDIWEGYMHSIHVPKEAIPWVRQDILSGHFYSWENVDFCEVEPGRILLVYDIQNWVEHPGAPPKKALRGIWSTKKGALD